jgi:hypothetical protein
VDVQIVYHDTQKDDDPNRAAITKTTLPKSVTLVKLVSDMDRIDQFHRYRILRADQCRVLGT